jgi:uncharacterized protein (DUF2147 family)
MRQDKGNRWSLLRRHFVGLLAFVASIAPYITPALPGLVESSNPLGLWYAEGGAAVVEIKPCGGALCGRVVWLHSPLDEEGCELRDKNNPDPALRNRPVIGLEILRGLLPSNQTPLSWTGGTIYDPVSGNTYRCRLKLESGDRLYLHGYLGIPLVGRTTTWTRVRSENTKCAQRCEPSNSTGEFVRP